MTTVRHWLHDHWPILIPLTTAAAVLLAAILNADTGTVAITLAGLILTAWIYTLTYQVQTLRDSIDEATDDADRAVRAVNQVLDHLTDREPPTTGRHVRRATNT